MPPSFSFRVCLACVGFIGFQSIVHFQASAGEFETSVNSHNYSENFTLDGFLYGLEDTSQKTGGTRSFTHNQVNVKYRPHKSHFKDLSLSLFWRYDYLADYTAETAQLTYASANDLPFENGTYDIDLYAKHIRAYGLSLGYDFRISPDITANITVSGILADDLVEGRVFGELELLDQDISTGVLDLDYRYGTDLIFPDRETTLAVGHGLTTDIKVDWQVTEDLKLNLFSRDIFSRIWWSDAPRTTADATTNIVRTDTNGILIVRPTLQGEHSQDSFTQEYRTRSDVAIEYKLNDRWELSQNLFKMKDIWLTTSKVNHEVTENLNLGVGFEWVSKSPGLQIEWHGLEISAYSDTLNVKNSRYLQLQAGVKLRF